jgi:hypothetical protein
MTTAIIRFPSIVLAALFAGTATGATPAVTMSGPHANEEFCKTMVRQVELGGEYMKNQALIPDMTKRAKYFNDQKELNAKLVKTAPASLTSDIVRFTKEGNDMYDAQLAGDRAKDKAAVAALTSPEHLAASKRMSAYCGVIY